MKVIFPLVFAWLKRYDDITAAVIRERKTNNENDKREKYDI